MQKMKQMLRDFCQKYAPINKPQSEVETGIDEFLTGVRNVSNMGSAEKLQSSAPSSGAQPASHLPQAYPHHPPSIASTRTPPRLILLCLCWAYPLLYFTAPPYCMACWTIHPSSATFLHSPSFASVVGNRQEQSQYTLAVQDGGADFTVFDRKKMRKGTTERSGSEQQALRGTWVNIDCRWAPTGIAKLWVTLPKQGVAMATISRGSQASSVSTSCRE